VTVKEAAERLGLEVLAAGTSDRQVTGGYASDLLSDVLAAAEQGSLWITHQRHMNVVAVAKLRDVAGVIHPRSLRPSQEVLDRAAREGVNILSSSEGAFEVAGKLYALLGS